jgi:hypothetical protein
LNIKQAISRTIVYKTRRTLRQQLLTQHTSS